MDSLVIQNVKSRLEFVSNLTSVKGAFRGINLIEDTENNGWTHPYKHFSALRYYLILTCFDILGSNSEFIDFSGWLTSSKHKTERETIFNSISDQSLCAGSLKAVYDKYNEIYGVSKGFKRFINEVISKENREKLLDSIKVRKIGYNPRKEIKYEPTENKKINFLYEIRNSFTHMGNSYASPAGGIFEDDGAPVVIDGKEKWGYQRIHIDERMEFYYEFSVRKWPHLLVDIVNDTIANNV
jgi:hypothetical protein